MMISYSGTIIFRVLVWAVTVLHIVYAPIPWPFIEHVEWVEYLPFSSDYDYFTPTRNEWVFILFQWIAIALWLHIGIGLSVFIPLVRFCFFLVVLISMLLHLYWAAEGIAVVFYSIENVTTFADACLLILCYYGPVSRRFEAREQSANPPGRRLEGAAASSDAKRLAALTSTVLLLLTSIELYVDGRNQTIFVREAIPLFEKRSAELEANGHAPRAATAYLGLSELHWNRFDYQSAERERLNAVRVAENAEGSDVLSEAYSELGWLYAVASDAELRNGKKALYFAQKAVALDSSPRNRTALAAALAESGRFDEAVSVQKSVVRDRRCGCSDIYVDEARLDYYDSGKSWRRWIW